MTGETYTVVFIDYGNQQPGTPAEHLYETIDGNKKPRAPSKSLSSQSISSVHEETDALIHIDEIIEHNASIEQRPRVNLSSSLSGQLRKATDAPPPPAPPPPPIPLSPESIQKARSRSRLEVAAAILAPSSSSIVTSSSTESQSGPFFGIELADLYVRDGTAIPKVLILAADELRKRSHVEGIFRIPGRANVVASLVERADKGVRIEFSKEETAEIASFLKKFFSLLPSPVIPADLVDRFGQTRVDQRNLCKELRQVVEQALPPERAEVLNFILQLLNDISRKSEQNKMTSKNLATVFLPALFFSVQGDSTSAEEIMKMAVLGKTVSATLSFMIDNPTLDPNYSGISDTNSTVSSFAPVTIPVASSSPQLNRRKSKEVSRVKDGARKRSNTSPDLSSSVDISSANGIRLSAESVLAAMRKAKERIGRRGGTFDASGGSFSLGRRGWLKLNKKKFWFLMVNDWLYWFKEERNSNQTTMSKLLTGFVGHVWLNRCNIISRKGNEFEIIMATTPNLVVCAETEQERNEWLVGLTEVCIAGCPLPAPAKIVDKSAWVNIRDQEFFAKLSDTKLTLFKDENEGKVIRTVALDDATVVKGKLKNGAAGFVLADALEKVVFGMHNAGAAQEWVDAIRARICIAWAAKYEPETWTKKY